MPIAYYENSEEDSFMQMVQSERAAICKGVKIGMLKALLNEGIISEQIYYAAIDALHKELMEQKT